MGSLVVGPTWVLRVVIGVLVIAGLCYIGIVAALYVGQRSLMYFPTSKRTAPVQVGLALATEVILDTSDGEKLIAWYLPPQGDQPVILFFHGNGDSLAGCAPRLRELAAAGVGFLALSYRGYAGSTGQPSEDGLHRDALAAYDFVAARTPPQRIALWGRSLGTGVAVALAAQRPVGRLVLEAPYTSTVDVAAQIYPFVPARLLMKDQFHSDMWIKSVKVPLLIVHGERDQSIPIALGERLFAMANEPKRFVGIPHGRHDDLENYGLDAIVLRFLAEP